jgi:hypothetical protein
VIDLSEKYGFELLGPHAGLTAPNGPCPRPIETLSHRFLPSTCHRRRSPITRRFDPDRGRFHWPLACHAKAEAQRLINYLNEKRDGGSWIVDETSVGINPTARFTGFVREDKKAIALLNEFEFGKAPSAAARALSR